jgi:hypothetical protein
MDKSESGYDPTKKNFKHFKYACVYRYDDVRPNRGTLRKSHPKDESGGSLLGRCQLATRGKRKCIFPTYNHLNCPLSRHRKPKKKQHPVLTHDR